MTNFTHKDISELCTLFQNKYSGFEIVTVRISNRAKHLIFKSSVRNGVEIIIPNKSKKSWVYEMVKKRVEWINIQSQKIESFRRDLNPSTIELHALSEKWIVDQPLDTNNHTTATGSFNIKIKPDPQDPFFVSRYLQEWVQYRAEKSLLPWIESIAIHRGLKLNKVRIKNQATRWGSCSASGNINLNRNLLFMPPHIVEYVLHHELNHITHLNHSEIFWDSLSEILPDYKNLKRELKQLEISAVPSWASIKID